MGSVTVAHVYQSHPGGVTGVCANGVNETDFIFLSGSHFFFTACRSFHLQNVTKGARHKIALSIQKLRERPSVLKSLEKVTKIVHCGFPSCLDSAFSVLSVNL